MAIIGLAAGEINHICDWDRHDIRLLGDKTALNALTGRASGDKIAALYESSLLLKTEFFGESLCML